MRETGLSLQNGVQVQFSQADCFLGQFELLADHRVHLAYYPEVALVQPDGRDPSRLESAVLDGLIACPLDPQAGKQRLHHALEVIIVIVGRFVVQPGALGARARHHDAQSPGFRRERLASLRQVDPCHLKEGRPIHIAQVVGQRLEAGIHQRLP